MVQIVFSPLYRNSFNLLCVAKLKLAVKKISVIDIGRRKTIFAALSFYRRCALSKWHTRPCLECAFQQAPRYREINPIWMILICNRIFFKQSLEIPFPTKNLRRKHIIAICNWNFLTAWQKVKWRLWKTWEARRLLLSLLKIVISPHRLRIEPVIAGNALMERIFRVQFL